MTVRAQLAPVQQFVYRITDMREAELNREMGRYAADKCDYAVLVDKKRGPDIKQGLLDGGFPEKRIFLTDSLEKGLEFTRGIEGSRMVLLLNDLPDHY